ncbi:MAG: biotin-dependent carboxyltransferase family protein [Pseudomonadota bacterium]
MSLTIIEPGLQTTLQAAPRSGLRHQGVPAAGPADAVSAALLNRAVGNEPYRALLEIPYGGFVAGVEGPATFAVGGAEADFTVNGVAVKPWVPVNLGRGVRQLRIGPITAGVQMYLAVAGGFHAGEFLGSASTYLPAAFGGYHGRALRAGDVLSVNDPLGTREPADVPGGLRPFLSTGWSLRATVSGETDWLTEASRERLFGAPFTVSRQTSRMGVGLAGEALELSQNQMLQSVPVFPGTVQCPESGLPFLLSADAQTTGGYPRVAQIIRADRHRLGQLRPGDQVTLSEVSPEEAASILHTKKAALAAFLGSDFQL